MCAYANEIKINLNGNFHMVCKHSNWMPLTCIMEVEYGTAKKYFNVLFKQVHTTQHFYQWIFMNRFLCDCQWITIALGPQRHFNVFWVVEPANGLFPIHSIYISFFFTNILYVIAEILTLLFCIVWLSMYSNKESGRLSRKHVWDVGVDLFMPLSCCNFYLFYS